MTTNAARTGVGRARLRFGLLSLCLFVGIAGATLGWVGKSILEHATIVQRHGFVKWQDKNGKWRDTLLSARWREVHGHRELIYLFVQPPGVHGYYLSLSSDFLPERDKRRNKHEHQIHLFHSGLALDGHAVPLTENQRVWIVSKDKELSLKPIEMERDEIKKITPETFDDLPTTKVWQEKIGPIWERERGPGP